MSEADWWLCSGCSSLNNLAARKCYSCGQRKPKAAQRASEYLGYVPDVSWDGKVTLRQLPIESRARALELGDAPPVIPAPPPPMREPLPRDTLAVAPRPPHPATITYRLEPPAPPAMPALPAMLHHPMDTPGHPPTVVGPAGPGGPVDPAAPRPEGNVPAVPSARPVVAVGPGPYMVPQSPAEQWPHWRELLDVPAPHAERLRPASPLDEDSPLAKRARDTGTAAGHAGSSMQRALQQAQGNGSPSRPFVPWPEADLHHRPVDEGAGDELPSPPTPRSTS
jgi:hypothetical protein